MINPVLSIIIPVYNELEILELCYTRVTQILQKLDLEYELIFIDDGSTDESANYLQELSNEDIQLKIILLSRNFGKEAALSAGIDYALGGAIIILDADLQDPPELIPDMLDAWKKEDVDVVLMKRVERAGESFTKKESAYWFYKILNLLSDFTIPEDVGDFRLMNRKSINALKELGEKNRYTKGLFAWIGMDTYTMEYKREARVGGEAKQGYRALFSLALEGITSFSIQPLRISTYLGSISAVFGFFFGLFIVLKAFFIGDSVQGYPSMVAIITFLGGVQLLSIGIVGEYVGKTYIESKKRPIYLIKKLITQKK